MTWIAIGELLQRGVEARLISPALLDETTPAGKQANELMQRHSARAQRTQALGSTVSVWIGAALLASFLIEINITDQPVTAIALGFGGLVVAAALARQLPTLLGTQLTWVAAIGGQILVMAGVGVLSTDQVTLSALALALEVVTLLTIPNLALGCAAVAAGTAALFVLVDGLAVERAAFGPLGLAFGAATAALWLAEARLAAGPLRRVWQPLAYTLPLALFVPIVFLTQLVREQTLWPYTFGFAALAGVVLVRAGSELPALAGATRWGGLAVIALLAALAPDAPGLAAGVLLLLLSHLRRNPAMQATALAAIGGFLFFWYYDLQTTLLSKSLAAIGNGAVLLIAAAALRRLTGQTRETDPQTTKRRLADLRWLAAALLLALAVPAWQVAAKERVLADGTPLLLRLRPVDPRSLMQGDYMVLRYAIADDARKTGVARHGALVIRLDADGVADLVRIDDGRPLAAGERLLRYRLRDGEVRLGAESFFFPEGTGDRYETAAFGELIAVDDGESVLVGLRDAERKRLGTPLH